MEETSQDKLYEREYDWWSDETKYICIRDYKFTVYRYIFSENKRTTLKVFFFFFKVEPHNRRLPFQNRFQEKSI